jgi:hypothetical protein
MGGATRESLSASGGVLVSYRRAAGMLGVLGRVVGLLDRRVGGLKQHHHDGGELPGLGG